MNAHLLNLGWVVVVVVHSNVEGLICHQEHEEKRSEKEKLRCVVVNLNCVKFV